MSEEVLVEVRGGVLEVTINRPAQRNAMTKAAAQAIAAAMDRLDAEAELRCAILTGAGGTFCAGMDLKGFLRGELPVDERGPFLRRACSHDPTLRSEVVSLLVAEAAADPLWAASIHDLVLLLPDTRGPD